MPVFRVGGDFLLSAQPAIRNDERIRQALEARIESGTLELPFLPSGVMQIVELCQNPESSSVQLAAAIHRDPALAGHVIRVANSPAYYPGTPVVSLQQAIGRLGQRSIAEIAVLISVKGSVLNVAEFGPEMRTLWRHAAGAGAYAREVARQMRRSVDSALLYGLLQNMGVPVLINAICTLEEELGLNLGKQETLEMADEYHPTVGSKLARQWSLPAVVADAILYHEDYRSAPTRGDEARVVALSDHLSNHLISGTTDPEVLAGHAAFAELNLYPDDVAALIEKGPEVLKFVETMR